MDVALIGGMDRLGRRYRDEAACMGIALRMFNGPESRLAARIGDVDAIVIFTDRVSHRARTEAVRVARSRNIPLHFRHSCGLCTFKDCLRCLKNMNGGRGDA